MNSGKKHIVLRRLKSFVNMFNIKILISITIIIFFALFIKPKDITDFSFYTEEAKEKLLSFVDYANIIKEFAPVKYFLYFAFIVIIIIWILKLYFYFFYKENVKNDKKIIHVIAHSSLNKTQFKLNKTFLENYELDVSEINLVELMEENAKKYTRINYVINVQDSIIKNFKNNINNNDNYGYMGIAHTPLVLRAGYKIGDETRFALFHKKRDKEYYDELSHDNKYEKIKVEKKDIKDKSKQLVVAISTTFQIKDEQLKQFDIDSNCILKFNIENKGYDVIKSYEQVYEYVNIILNEIMQIVEKKDIDKIHITISSSIALTFALGQALSSNYHPEVIIYHYDYNNPNDLYYPWGISVVCPAWAQTSR